MPVAESKLRTLAPEQVAKFRIDGYLVIEDLLTAAEVARLTDLTDLIAAGKASHIPEESIQLEPVFREGEREVENQVLSVRKLYNLAVHDDVLWEGYVTNPRVVDVIADLLGTDDIKLYGDQLFMKPPVVGSEQPWHQDSESWRDILPMGLVSAWIAIDDATVDNGCLNFAPGTHRWGMLTKPRLKPLAPDLGADEWPIAPAPLRAGSVSFHHSLVLHQSNANTSGKRRRGYACHYMRATSYKDETITDAPKMPPFRQVRGRSFSGRV